MPHRATRPSRPAQLRALTGVFLARFFEHEATPAPTDMRQSFFWLVALLATPGIFLPLYMTLRWSNFAAAHGVAALRVAILVDKAIYLNLTFVSVGIVSAVVWHALLPDRRDGLVLNGLPVSTPTVYSAKLLSLAAYAGLIAAGMHTPAALLYGLGFGLPEGPAGVAGNLTAMFLTSAAINAFVITAVAGVQSVGLAMAGPRMFARISPAMQLLLVAAATTLLVLLPAIAGRAPALASWPGHTSPLLVWSPPIWFVGLYEVIAGSRAPIMTALANRAILGLGVSTSLLLLTYPLASRRALTAAIEGAEPGSAAVRARRRSSPASFLAGWLTPDAHERASVQLLLSTLARIHQHRLMLSVAAGVGLAAVMPIAASAIARDGVPEPGHDIALLAAPLLLMFTFAIGVRVAAALPSELPAAWIFPVAPAPMFAGRHAVRRVMLALGVGAPLALAGPVWIWLWGPAAAFVHLIACTLGGLVLVDALLWGFVGVPCAKPLAPARASLQSRWPVFMAGLYVFAYSFPSWQITVLDRFGAVLMLSPLLLIWSIVSRGSASAAHANGVSGDPHDLLSLNLNIVPAGPPVLPKERHA